MPYAPLRQCSACWVDGVESRFPYRSIPYHRPDPSIGLSDLGMKASASTSSAPAFSPHFWLTRDRRSSSSGGSSSASSNCGVPAQVSDTAGNTHGRKRRRHSTFSSNALASDSDKDEEESTRPAIRLRLASYVSLGRTRSHSPGSASQPLSPSSALRQRHRLRIETRALAPTSCFPRPLVTSHGIDFDCPSAQRSESGDGSDMDIDIDLGAMQVDSPSPSPMASSSSLPLFSSATTLIEARLATSRPSAIPAGLLSPLSTDTPYPSPAFARAPSPTAGVGPTMVTTRRSSHHHFPASSSPLARNSSFPSSSSRHDTQFQPHQHPFSQTFDPCQQSVDRDFLFRTRSRSSSTPPSPAHPSQEVIDTRQMLPASPLRRHSDGQRYAS